jgi:hypothetical protein
MAIPCPFKGCKSQIASKAKLPGHFGFKHKGQKPPGTVKEAKPTKRRKYTRHAPALPSAAPTARLSSMSVVGLRPSITAKSGPAEFLRPPGAAEQMRDLAATLETKAKLLKSMADDLDRIG